MAADGRGTRIAAVRRFNRFYTRQIGVLEERFNRSPFSLAEARVLYEIAHRSAPTASELVAALGLDAGYLSRMVAGFVRRRLVVRRRSRSDARRAHLALTARGRVAFGRVDAVSQRDVGAMLARLPEDGQERVTSAMRSIEALLAERPPAPAPWRLRGWRPGDLGWVVERHGAVYAAEYGWGSRIEALAADIVAGFIQRGDPRERCWIAERDGERGGCVMLVRKSDAVAQLRLLLVEPAARGQGLGRRLVDECTRFARRAGYRRSVLWTNGALDAARHIYKAAGYRLVRTDRHDDFGPDPHFEVWRLDLEAAQAVAGPGREPRSFAGVPPAHPRTRPGR